MAEFHTKHPEDFFRYGLQFEKDRSFKNRLIVRVVLCMTVLILVCATVLIGWSKVRGIPAFHTVEETRVTIIIKKVPVNYDSDTVQIPNERTVLPDVRTEFIPSYSSSTTGSSRPKRDVSQQLSDGTHVPTGSTTANQPSESLSWTNSVEKSKRNVVDPDEKRNTETKASLPARGTVTRQVFWTTKGDAESIRKSQADTMLSYMDTSVDPCQDFYQYACGRWGDHNQIPEDRAAFDTFEMLRESLDSVLRDLLLEESEDDIDAVKKAKMLFKSCMEEDILEKRGNTPLLTLLDSFGGWPMIEPNWNETDFDWLDLSAKLRLYNNEILIMQWVGPDFRSSSTNIIQFDQALLGLPTREYFLQERNKASLEAYRTFMIRVAVLLGADADKAAADADQLLDFETKLANLTTPADQRRNVSEMYEKLPLNLLEMQIPQISWRKYLTVVLSREPEPEEPVVMFARKYYNQLIVHMQAYSPRVIANYIMWRFVKNRINNLGSQFQEAKQELFRALFGREKSPPRWSICVIHVNSNMGMAVGSLFVSRYFDENSKNDTLMMVHGIMDAFKDILDDSEWIDGDTRQMAKQKVANMILRIGFPDFILNTTQLNQLYENVLITNAEYFENTLNLLQHMSKTEQNRLGAAVDKLQWGSPPAIVNAYYSRNKNQIMFPAGILQPPFYHRHFPRSLNYGGIGVVIGHEITHGFDDKGRLFDMDGNLHRWWKEEAIEGFRTRAKCLIDQYNAYVVKEVEMRIDGISTQGENIADNGGIKQAYKAYQKWIQENGEEDELLPGVNATNWQLFFINFAQVWCGSTRPEASRSKLQTAVHSPGRYRVIGTLSNSVEFSRAFNCGTTSDMNPSLKCSVW